MRKTKQRQVTQRLGAVHRRVERWRKRGGGKGSRMPEELWQEATEVARVEGVYAVSRALCVDYNRLKARVASTAKTSSLANSDGPDGAFVELEASQICGGCKTVIELVGRAGDRMRLEVAGKPEVDIVLLTQTFLSQQS